MQQWFLELQAGGVGTVTVPFLTGIYSKSTCFVSEEKVALQPPFIPFPFTSLTCTTFPVIEWCEHPLIFQTLFTSSYQVSLLSGEHSGCCILGLPAVLVSCFILKKKKRKKKKIHYLLSRILLSKMLRLFCCLGFFFSFPFILPLSCGIFQKV